MWKTVYFLSLSFLLSDTTAGQSFGPSTAATNIQRTTIPNPECAQKIAQSRNLAINFYKQQQYSNAYNAYLTALEQAKDCSDESQQLPVLLDLAKFLKNRGNQSQALAYMQQHLQVATALKSRPDSIINFWRQSDIYTAFGDYPKALGNLLNALALAEKKTKSPLLAELTSDAGLLYSVVGDYSQAFQYQKRALLEIKKGEINLSSILIFGRIGETHLMKKQYREAIPYFEQALQQAKSLNNQILIATYQGDLADSYEQLGDYKNAFKYGFQGLATVKRENHQGFITWISLMMARAYLHTGKPDSALLLAAPAYKSARQLRSKENTRDAANILAEIYSKRRDYARAFQFEKEYTTNKDSLNSELTSRRIAYLQHNQQLRQKQSQISELQEDKFIKDRLVSQQRLVVVMLLVGLAVGAFLVYGLKKANRKLKETNALLAEQKEEINQQADRLQQQNKEISQQRQQLQNTLTELRATQNQLVLKEKMASLGELATGIAHEIQNPLNFVNNFAILSTTLVSEIKGYFKPNQASKPLEVADTLSQNLGRIVYHGQRAESIIKGMLQHSHIGTGERQLVDLNALANEYLQLTYKGIQLKSSNISITLHTNFQPGIDKVIGVPQDLGRVFVNLYTNAFYTVLEKAQQSQEDYHPTLWVSSECIAEHVILRIKDNGMGIPANILHKIFQPFFTTKPTGQGTGLGLSLSNDIIKKGHSGSLTVDTQWGEFTEFTITLPV